MASDFTPHSNPLSVPPGCNVVFSDQDFSQLTSSLDFRIDCLRRINWRNIEGADVGRIIQNDLSQLLVNIDDLAFADFEREPYYVTPTQEGMQLIQHSQLVLQYLLFTQRKVLQSMGSLQKLEQISSKQRAKIKRLTRESQALDEQAYHFEIILNRNRPDLKLVEEALEEQKPDIRTDQAKDFVMNILKATGLAPFEQENLRPQVDKHVFQAIQERDKKKAQWHSSIHKMAQGNYQDFQQYQPDIHSIPTPSRSFVKGEYDQKEESKGQDQKFSLSHFGGSMKEDKERTGGEESTQRVSEKTKQIQEEIRKRREQLEKDRKEEEERKRKEQIEEEEQRKRKEEREAERKRLEEIKREEEKERLEKQKEEERKEEQRKKEEILKRKQKEEERKRKEEEDRKEKLRKEEEERKEKLRKEEEKKKKEKEEEQKKREEKKKREKEEEMKKNEVQKRDTDLKAALVVGTLQGSDQEEEEYSQEFEDLENTKEAFNKQEEVESKRVNETPEPNMDELIKLREAMFSTQKKDQKLEERDSSLDRTDPIAAMLQDDEDKEEEKEEEKKEIEVDEKTNSNGFEKPISEKLPLAPARKSPRAGPSRTVMKALDDDSIDQMEQSGDVLSQGTLNIHIQDESRNLDEITSSRQEKGTNVLNLGQSADLGESDTFELSASHSVFPAFRPGGRPLLSSLTTQGSTFGGGSSGALLLGKSKRGGTRDVRSASQKFSNYHTSYSEVPQVEEQDIH